MKIDTLSLTALIAAIFANSIANFLIKKAGAQGGNLGIYLNPWFIGGIAFFGVNLLCYTYALKVFPLSIAYPLMVGGTLLLVTLMAAYGLGEALTGLRLAGMALILFGATMVIR